MEGAVVVLSSIVLLLQTPLTLFFFPFLIKIKAEGYPLGFPRLSGYSGCVTGRITASRCSSISQVDTACDTWDELEECLSPLSSYVINLNTHTFAVSNEENFW